MPRARRRAGTEGCGRGRRRDAAAGVVGGEQRKVGSTAARLAVSALRAWAGPRHLAIPTGAVEPSAASVNRLRRLHELPGPQPRLRIALQPFRGRERGLGRGLRAFGGLPGLVGPSALVGAGPEGWFSACDSSATTGCRGSIASTWESAASAAAVSRLATASRAAAAASSSFGHRPLRLGHDLRPPRRSRVVGQHGLGLRARLLVALARELAAGQVELGLAREQLQALEVLPLLARAASEARDSRNRQATKAVPPSRTSESAPTRTIRPRPGDGAS